MILWQDDTAKNNVSSAPPPQGGPLGQERKLCQDEDEKIVSLQDKKKLHKL